MCGCSETPGTVVRKAGRVSLFIIAAGTAVPGFLVPGGLGGMCRRKDSAEGKDMHSFQDEQP